MEYDTGDTPNAQADEPKAKGLMDSAKLAKKWQVELNASKRWLAPFHRAARQCEKAYLDQSDGTVNVGDVGANDGKVNLFWANVQVTLSAIYGRMPVASVERKFKDFEDDTARVAGIIMERLLNGDIEREHDDAHAAMRDGVQDRFVSGLGQVWIRYDFESEEFEEPALDPMGQPIIGPDGSPVMTQGERIINEEAEVDYVYWDDFRYSPCRRWRECRWVARRAYMSEAKLRKRFKLTEQQVAMIPMHNRTPDGADGDGNREDDVLKATPFRQAAVWEIWDKEGNYVCWYVEGCTFVLDRRTDPLQLDDFFPCPQPIVATTLTKAFRPRPDYAMAQDLYKALDRINCKLSHLTDAVKAAGVYDKNAAPVKSLLTTAVENALVPVDNWSTFVEKGGMKGVVDWLPIEAFVNAIAQLNQRKDKLQHDLYEVLGISDIMRGASFASETATAQKLKVQYGGARLANLQAEVSRFVSAVMRIRADIICKHFQPDTIRQRSLIDQTPDAALADQAIALLKDRGTAMFRVMVTADSLAAPDWAAEKEARTEFLGATSNYLMAAAPMVQQNPMVGSFLMKLLQWAAAGFKGAQTIEGVLDEAARQLERLAQQPPAPPQPTPEDRKHAAQANKAQAEADRTAKETALLPLPVQPLPPGVTTPPGGPSPGALPRMPMPAAA